MKIAPSIIAADFGRLADAAKAAERAGADLLHIDVMDGQFVPNITVGPGTVGALRKACRIPLDVHLMIEEPDRFLHAFCEPLGEDDYVTVHVEACRHLHKTLQVIVELGVKAGVAINPATPIGSIACVLDHVDMITIMTVNPGFAGQDFLPGVLPKIREARELVDRHGQRDKIAVEVDGGITEKSGRLAVEHGADILAAGVFVFSASSMAKAIARLRSLAVSKEEV